MILITHILIALASLVGATVAWAKPSTTKLHVTYGLIAATLVSGTYLVVSTHANLLSSCETGLIYLAVSVTATVSAHHKLATARKQID